MLRALRPYFLTGLVISGFAGWAVGAGHLSVIGSYGFLTVAVLIVGFGYDRWDRRQRDGRRPRR